MPRQKSSNNYFTQETEDYIVKYNNSDDPEYRSKIFTNHIYFPFYKLVENIIHTFKFYNLDIDTIEDLKHEVISVLVEQKLKGFDPTNGAKAYSYFGTIVKRWLINYSNKNYKKLQKRGALEEVDFSFEEDLDLDDKYSISLSNLIDEFVEESYQKIEEGDMFVTKEEKKVADAVLTLFKTRNDLKVFKKKALYIYIRNITGYETPHLTRVVTKLKEEFYTLYDRYNKLGLLSLK